MAIKQLVIGGGNRPVALFERRRFKNCGKNVHFSPLNSEFSYKTLVLAVMCISDHLPYFRP